jgi:hypothetical protein
MPIKLTWKSILGVLSMVAGALTAAVSQANALHLPASVSAGLVAVGGIVVAAERIADALDYKTTGGVNVGAIVAELRTAKADAEAAKDQAAVAYQAGKRDLLAALDRASATPQTTTATSTPSSTGATPAT